MTLAKNLLLRAALLIAAMVMFGLDANEAFAQSRNCQALANTLQQIERNGSFASLVAIHDPTPHAQDAMNAAAASSAVMSSGIRWDASAASRR